MKRNATLLLIELVIMLLVFSLASVVCLQVFYKADMRGVKSQQMDTALLNAQNVAEVLKANKGNLALCSNEFGGQANEKWIIYFDKDWNIQSSQADFCLEVSPIKTETALLGEAKITVSDRSNNILSQLSVCWQEVAP